MKNISINYENVRSTAKLIVNKVQTEVIDASVASANKIQSCIENSSGEFIDAFKEELKQEMTILGEAGELLIAIANYVLDFAQTAEAKDESYSNSKV